MCSTAMPRQGHHNLLLVIHLLLIAGLLSCHGSNKRIPVVNTTSLTDTLWKTDSTWYVELIDKKMDSAERIDFLSQYCLSRLKLHPGDAAFDTAVLIDGFNGHLYFSQGTLFSDNRVNALVYICDNNKSPFLLFTKEKDWALRQVVYGNGRLADSAFRLLDYNFDGRKDLIVRWNYTAGRCSCGSNDCWNVYLYKETTDSLLLCPATNGYLDYGISPAGKAVYLGEHCDGFFGKFRWVGDSLVKVEAYLTDEGYLHSDGPYPMEHVLYNKQGGVSSRKKQHQEIPLSWRKAFGWKKSQ